MIEKKINLQSFVEFIKDKIPNNNDYQIFNETVNNYEMSLGGCGCSRKTREKYADDKFIQKINGLDLNILADIKSKLGLKNEDLLLFLDKDGGLIRQV